MTDEKGTKYGSYEIWLSSLKSQQSYLRQIEAHGLYSPKIVEKTRQRIERIWNAGLPEWREEGEPSCLP